MAESEEDLDLKQLEAEMAAEAFAFLRQEAAEITGGNCAYLQDDVRILAYLARRAAESGQYQGLHSDVKSKMDRIWGVTEMFGHDD